MRAMITTLLSTSPTNWDTEQLERDQSKENLKDGETAFRDMSTAVQEPILNHRILATCGSFSVGFFDNCKGIAGPKSKVCDLTILGVVISYLLKLSSM